MSQTKNSVLGRIKVAKLGYGIHDNIVITNVDVEDRKFQGTPERKMIYITFSSIDPVSKKKLAEAEVSWFKIDDHTSDYLFSNIRELAVQLHGILSCYMTEEEAFDAMEEVFADWNFKDLDELEHHKWKKKELGELMVKFRTVFAKAVAPYVGDITKLIRLKLTTDSKGEYVNIPKFGVFTEPMSVKSTNLKFSDYELRNHSKAGITDAATNV